MLNSANKYKGIYAVIPAFNEQETVGEVVSSVMGYTSSVVIVDDGSTDHTAELASARGASVITHTRNMGYDRSIEDGFKYVGQQDDVRAVFTFDADGQHKSEILQDIIQPILDDRADIVVGVRPYKARLAETLLGIYTKRKFGIIDPLCGLKIYKIEVFRDIGYFDRINSIGTELILRAQQKGYRVLQVPISIIPRIDHSRFGQAIKGNYKIFKAFLRIVLSI